MRISDLPRNERPAERLLINGARNLNIIEILTLIIGTKNAIYVANALILRFKSIQGIMNATCQDLISIQGIGSKTASKLLAIIEIAKRINNIHEEDVVWNDVIHSPESIFPFLLKKCSNLMKEHFYVISLNTRNRIIAIDEVSVGTLTASLVHPRETFEIAIQRHSAGIIVAHNHPSGEVEPSEDDLKITKRLAEAGRIMGINVLDHIIFTKISFMSFKERNLM